MMVGLGMYGGMMGIGTVMMASQMIARHNMNKKYNQSTGQGQAPTPKDKLAKADRRRSQELKLKGELDSDYQKELAEKGLTPANAPMPGSPPNFAPSTGGPGFGQGASSFNGGPGAGMGMGQGQAMGMGQGQAMGMGQGQAMGMGQGQAMGMGQGQAMNSGMSSGMNSGINPSMNPATNPSMNTPAATGAGEVFNPSPWTPNSD